MKKLIIVSIAFLFAINIYAQDAKLSVSVDRENVLMGNPFQVSFILENVSAKHFETPDFHDFDIVSTSQSSQTSIINGDMTQSTTYNYILAPRSEGTFYIDPVSVETKDGVLETEPLEITILANPDGKKEEIKGKNKEDGFGDFFFFKNDTPIPPSTPTPHKKRKKKRKTYRL